MIWRPLPQIKPQPEVAAPNILAFRMPLIATAASGSAAKAVCAARRQSRGNQRIPRLRCPSLPRCRRSQRLKQNPALTAESSGRAREPSQGAQFRATGGAAGRTQSCSCPAGGSRSRNCAAFRSRPIAGREHGGAAGEQTAAAYVHSAGRARAAVRGSGGTAGCAQGCYATGQSRGAECGHRRRRAWATG